jgi:hypothetical protein
VVETLLKEPIQAITFFAGAGGIADCWVAETIA